MQVLKVIFSVCFAVSEGGFRGRAYRDHFSRRSHAHDVEGLVLPTFQVLPSPSKWAGGSITGLLKELLQRSRIRVDVEA